MNSTTVLSKSGLTALDDVRSEKLRPFHRERLAVIYVRQSTPQQVLNHQESTRLQYGLVSRAQAEDIVLYASDVTTIRGNWAVASGAGTAGNQQVASADNGWSLSFSNGAELDVRDNGRIAVSGKGRKSVASLLGLAGKSIGSRKPRSSAPSHR